MLAFSASEIAAAPLSSMLLVSRFKNVSTVLFFSASAIAAAPMSLMYAFIFVTDVVVPPRMAFATAFFARHPVISC